MLKVAKALVDLLIPKICFCCGVPSSKALCLNCLDLFTFINHPFCRKCGYPTLYEVRRCRQCSNKRLHFKEARSLLPYEGKAKDTLIALKTESAYSLADFFIRLALAKFPRDYFDVKAITFIPAIFIKKIRRSHNASEILAKALAYHLGLPLIDILLPNRRVRDQAALNIEERQKNLKGAFRIRKGIKANSPILIVDDIYTTGATVNEASRALASIGIETKVFTVGRTL